MMNTRLWGIGIVLVVCAAAVACVSYGYPPPSRGPVPTTVAPAGGSDQPFYEDLAPYGRWVYATGPGWAWSPSNVQAGWRPYQLGHWVFTDYGWTWASEEQWGSVVYHYGRWNQDPAYGWVWVPGTEWGPAWVAWHEGGGFVGWAPLPWQVSFRAEVGLDWGGVNVTLEPSSWCFVNARNLVDPGMRNYIMPATRNVSLIQVTKNVTNYTYIDNRVVNQGVTVEKIGRAVGHTIPRYRVAEASSPEETRGGKVRGEEFVVFRPDPSRGRNSQGRFVPPGHDERHERGRFRQAAPQPEPAPVAGQPAAPQPVPPAGTPSGPPSSAPAPANQAPAAQAPPAPPQERDSQRGRGHKFLDPWMGQRKSPRNAPPPQAAAPAQPAAAPAPPAASAPPAAPAPPAPPQQSTAPAPPAARSANPGSGGQHGATPPPANAAPEKPHPENARGKGHKDDVSKTGKHKEDAPKSDGSDSGH